MKMIIRSLIKSIFNPLSTGKGEDVPTSYVGTFNVFPSVSGGKIVAGLGTQLFRVHKTKVGFAGTWLDLLFKKLGIDMKVIRLTRPPKHLFLQIPGIRKDDLSKRMKKSKYIDLSIFEIGGHNHRVYTQYMLDSLTKLGKVKDIMPLTPAMAVGESASLQFITVEYNGVAKLLKHLGIVGLTQGQLNSIRYRMAKDTMSTPVKGFNIEKLELFVVPNLGKDADGVACVHSERLIEAGWPTAGLVRGTLRKYLNVNLHGWIKMRMFLFSDQKMNIIPKAFLDVMGISAAEWRNDIRHRCDGWISLANVKWATNAQPGQIVTMWVQLTSDESSHYLDDNDEEGNVVEKEHRNVSLHPSYALIHNSRSSWGLVNAPDKMVRFSYNTHDSLRGEASANIAETMGDGEVLYDTVGAKLAMGLANKWDLQRNFNKMAKSQLKDRRFHSIWAIVLYMSEWQGKPVEPTVPHVSRSIADAFPILEKKGKIKVMEGSWDEHIIVLHPDLADPMGGDSDDHLAIFELPYWPLADQPLVFETFSVNKKDSNRIFHNAIMMMRYPTLTRQSYIELMPYTHVEHRNVSLVGESGVTIADLLTQEVIVAPPVEIDPASMSTYDILFGPMVAKQTVGFAANSRDFCLSFFPHDDVMKREIESVFGLIIQEEIDKQKKPRNGSTLEGIYSLREHYFDIAKDRHVAEAYAKAAKLSKEFGRKVEPVFLEEFREKRYARLADAILKSYEFAPIAELVVPAKLQMDRYETTIFNKIRSLAFKQNAMTTLNILERELFDGPARKLATVEVEEGVHSLTLSQLRQVTCYYKVVNNLAHEFLSYVDDAGEMPNQWRANAILDAYDGQLALLGMAFLEYQRKRG